MIKIPEASPETIERVQQSWEIGKIKLFARNGTNPQGKIGQNLANNPALCETCDKIANLYIPIAARKLELLEYALQIRTKNPQAEEAEKKLNKIRLEEIILDGQLRAVNDMALNILYAKGSGFDSEKARRTDLLSKDVAQEIIGSVIGTVNKGIKSPAVTPLDEFFPKGFSKR